MGDTSFSIAWETDRTPSIVPCCASDTPAHASLCSAQREPFVHWGSGETGFAWVTPLSQHLAQPCNTQQFLKALVQVDNLQLALCCFRRDVQTDHRTQPGAVHVAHIRQIQHDGFAFRKQRFDCRFQRLCCARLILPVPRTIISVGVLSVVRFSSEIGQDS